MPAWDRMPLLEVQTEGQAVQVASFTEVPALPRAAPHRRQTARFQPVRTIAYTNACCLSRHSLEDNSKSKSEVTNSRLPAAILY